MASAPATISAPPTRPPTRGNGLTAPQGDPFGDWIELNVWVTPERATALLALNTYDIQRNKRTAWIEEFRREILDGRFERGTEVKLVHLQGTGEVLLADAQHRLEGLLASGKGAYMDIRHYMARDIDEVRRIYLSIDGGHRRSPSDVLKAFENSSELQTKAISALGLIENRFAKYGGGAPSLPRSRYAEALETWARPIELYGEAISAGDKHRRRLLLKQAPMAVGLILCADQSELGPKFIRAAAWGAASHPHEAHLQLINYLQNNGAFGTRSFAIARVVARLWNKFFDFERGKDKDSRIARIVEPSALEIAGTRFAKGWEKD